MDDEYEELEFTPLVVLTVHLNGDVEMAANILDALAEYAYSMADNLSTVPGIAFTAEEPRGIFITLEDDEEYDEGILQ